MESYCNYLCTAIWHFTQINYTKSIINFYLDLKTKNGLLSLTISFMYVIILQIATVTIQFKMHVVITKK